MRHIIKIVALILAMLSCISLWGVDIIANNGEAESGKSFDYPINISDADKLGGIGFTVLYNPALFELKDLNGGNLASNAMIEYNEVESGKILVSMVDANGINGDGELILLKFKTIGDVGDNSEITLEEARAYDTDLLDVPFNLNNGSIAVIEAGGIALPGIKIEYIIIGALALLVVFLFGRMSRKRAVAH